MVENGSPSDGGYGGADDAVFVPGVDYVSPWREADEVAREVIAAAEELGLDARVVRAVPHTGPRGEPVVWLYLDGARLLARALRDAARGRRARIGGGRPEGAPSDGRREPDGRREGVGVTRWLGMTGGRRRVHACGSRRTGAGSSFGARAADGRF